MNAQKGYIYILTNPSFPDYVKIGYADDVGKRLKQLNKSECTPYAFRVYATYEVFSRLSDLKMHNIIDKLNPDLRSIETVENKKRVREFYAMSADDAYNLLLAIAQMHGYENRLNLVVPDTKEKEDEETAKTVQKEKRERKNSFSFNNCGIKPGSIIKFIHDESIECIVVNDRTIEYCGKQYSMSGLAQKLLKTKNAVQGTLYFSYNNEILTDLRNRLENENKK